MEQGEDIARREAGMSAARAYELVRKELLTEFGQDFYRSYLEQLRLVAEWNGALLFRAGSSIAQERLKQQALHRLEARMRAYVPDLGPIEILQEREFPEEVRALVNARIEAATQRAGDNGGAGGGNGDGAVESAGEHPHSFTFDAFCVDQSNFRAFTVAQMIANSVANKGPATFPIWLLHSPPGCGKSHLGEAIAFDIAQRAPDRKVLKLTGQEFLEGFQSALQRKQSSSFKEMVRAPDLLIIDDFQRVCGKKATEEEAFDTMNELVRRGGQVVLIANHGADGLTGLDEALRGKLKGAAACEIGEPGVDLRRRILEMRVKHYARVTPGFSVAAAALDMIAERMLVSGRELDGAVSQLVIEAKISGGMEVTVESAVNALQGKLSDGAERRITVQMVQKVVARYYNMSVQQLLERTRRHAIARPRQVAMFLATKMTRASLPDIGERFGGFDHTTIMYSRDRIGDLLREDVKLKSEIDNIAKLIRREP